MTCRLALSISVALMCLPAAAQQNLRGRTFTDKTHGYEITIPSDWVRLPINVEEKWIIAHFVSKKEYLGSAKAGDSLMGHKPYMKVIVFDDEVIKKYVEIERDEGTTTKRIKHPYRDYKDYVKRNLTGGGFFFSKEEKGSLKDIPVTRYQVKLEKLAADKKRYVGWLFESKGVKFAVEFELLESQFDKLDGPVFAALNSFKLIERTGPTSTKAEDAILRKSYDADEWGKLSAEARHDIRVEIDKAREAKMLARLPEGWTVTRSKHFLVLSHGSKKYTKKVVDAAEAFREWIDERFGMLTDEYAMKAVIRICKNAEEYGSYHSGSSQTSFNFRNREIVTYDEYAGFQSEVGGLFWEIYGFYMQDKAPELLFSAPIWLDSGLDRYISSAMLKGRKVLFLRSIREFVDFAELRRMPEGSIKTAQELMNLDSIALARGAGEKQADLNLGSQIATFFRFMEGPGRRLSFLKGKDFLIEYMQAVLATAKEFDTKGGIRVGGMKEATTEEEEEQQAEQSKARWADYAKQAKARRAEFLKKLQSRIAQWSDADWKTLERAYAAYHKKKTR